ncbi:hypothetical protein HA49_16735 [Tatumella morbirosei]|uniref:Uncharacterized protein n=1 Tax=Tatumella morbirosei TaxID=642227 RepID=A0A095UD65_9GAMM|nr:hypothetical protein [Tatumella morbirosei]KGD72378.1 hypothetical protein HA49_16735 [Tatumella morbirosei]
MIQPKTFKICKVILLLLTALSLTAIVFNIIDLMNGKAGTSHSMLITSCFQTLVYVWMYIRLNRRQAKA